MPDHAVSTHPAVQAQLDRLASLSPGADVLGLERITQLLGRLGDPQRDLPPVFHVAGTNGKGSTCAFLRAALEAAGYPVHAYTSPHLVRFNERIRLAGHLIEDEALAALLEEVLDAGNGIGASFFEVTTAAAFLAFARTPAAATIVEVGLGGRLDATNVIPDPLVTGIAALGLDHQDFLGRTLPGIAREKAGIAKRGVPLVTMRYPVRLRDAVAEVAAAAGAPVVAQDEAWSLRTARRSLEYTDPGFVLPLDKPRMVGAHQSANLGLAIAMLRHQGRLAMPDSAIRAAPEWAHWPARMQRLGGGPLRDRLPSDAELWLDGCHNPSAAVPVARALARVAGGRPVDLVLGMLANKDAAGVLTPLVRVAGSLTAVPVERHAHHDPAALAKLADWLGLEAHIAADPATALDAIAARRGASPVVAILGSLYLAGGVLSANDELPQ